ncbi:DUF2335 domain-containing protein [Micromonospora sp. NPDC047707]|uniref:DUF2335 domain-containing protein n=1 Tax=Micromonospora sp. NPDC047707 TaxID=3154498 RepID=UPI003452A3B6
MTEDAAGSGVGEVERVIPAPRSEPDPSREVELVDLRVSREQLEQWSSPFVPSHELQRLDAVVENGAERAFRYAEREQEHRLGMDERQAQRLERADRREYVLAWAGMGFAFMLASTAIGAGVFLGYKGQPIAGTILGGGGLVLIVAAFLRRPKQEP